MLPARAILGGTLAIEIEAGTLGSDLDQGGGGGTYILRRLSRTDVKRHEGRFAEVRTMLRLNPDLRRK